MIKKQINVLELILILGFTILKNKNVNVLQIIVINLKFQMSAFYHQLRE